MAKQKKASAEIATQAAPVEPANEPVDVAFKLIIKDGWFVVQKVNVPKECQVIEETNPDIFPIFLSHLTRMAREHFGI